MSTEKAVKNALSGRSKTINWNAAAVPAAVVLVWLCRLKGIDMPPEVAAAFVALGFLGINIPLRFLTKKPLSEKGAK